jgi:isoleucyl-tRNA synthetase
MADQKTIDYKGTLNLPRTDFKMKANLNQMEPEILKAWKKDELYKKIRHTAKGKPKYILHDGPPYANGHIHLGHCLNKILKDIIVKSKTMSGMDCYFVPGWDCHGLPIEYQVMKDLGPRKEGKTIYDIRHICREYADKFVKIQREEFRRIGIFGDWDNPYLTMDFDYEATIAGELGNFIKTGGLYRGKKPVYWCYHCETALAEAEVEYDDKVSPTVHVKFPFESDTLISRFPSLKGKKVFALIWTTTPWTLPANLALAFNPEFTYVAVDHKGEVLILAEALAEKVLGNEIRIIERFKGSDMEGLEAKHPFYDRSSLLTLGKFVTLDAGTGIVHIAPGHGQDDYEIGVKYDLEIYAPVDEKGVFTDGVEYFAGMFVYDANESIIDKLREVGNLLDEGNLTHSYPHCWRCKNPIIFRATPQWFISMETNGLRSKALNEIERVKWIPPWGKERIYNMVQNRPDWCVSRQRVWGVPIAIFYCSECDYALLDPEIVYHVAEVFRARGSDVWFKLDVNELIPAGTKCPECGDENFVKETDILDVWFDSGVSFSSVLERNPELYAPADMYLEGSDQHRGWFHSSLLVSVGTRNKAPYKSVLTHGFVVDKEGEKMSKSKGNVISPSDILSKYGAEILRLWVAAEDYRGDIRISTEILDRLIESYRKIRNTLRYLLGNLFDFDPSKERVEYDELYEIDKWILHKLGVSSNTILAAYDRYEFHVVYHELQRFCIVDLSSVYMDVQKDLLYTYHANSGRRKSSQTAMYMILTCLTRLSAPILTFTADEVWRFIPGTLEESVHLSTFRPVGFIDNALEEKWNKLIAFRDEILKALEMARNDKTIRSSLEAGIEIYGNPDTVAFVSENLEFIRVLSIVSHIEIVSEPPRGADFIHKSTEIGGLTVKVVKAPGEKCERCWTYRTSVGDNPDHPTICHVCVDNLRGRDV